MLLKDSALSGGEHGIGQVHPGLPAQLQRHPLHTKPAVNVLQIWQHWFVSDEHVTPSTSDTLNTGKTAWHNNGLPEDTTTSETVLYV